MSVFLTLKRPKPLNAISPTQPPEPDDRTTRHLRMCAELADLAMQLARAAAARTLAALTVPEGAEPSAAAQPQPKPAPDAQSDPETAPPTNPAPTANPSRTAASHKPTDPAVLFTRFAAVVRDCIALEARLTAGSNTTPRAATLQRRADPRRALLRDAFHRAVENHPDRAELLRETTTRLDEELAADADQTAHPADLFATICDELGIEIDIAHLPDELLSPDTETTYPGEDPDYALDPRAASPP